MHPDLEMTIFTKKSVDKELPTESGKYIVYTITPHGNGNIFNCEFHIKENGKHTWSCSNQKVTHWLKSL